MSKLAHNSKHRISDEGVQDNATCAICDHSWPLSKPIYHIEKSYLENAENGPFFQDESLLQDIDRNQSPIQFLGKTIHSPIGIASGPLLNSKWVELASKLNFDVLCYKTIRSSEHFGHPVPNMLYVQSKEQITGDSGPQLVVNDTLPSDITDLAVTNSFGMPSRSNEYLRKDIPKAIQCLKPGQLLIVSIVGSENKEMGISLFDDFVQTAELAIECGAEVVEANFSCPNVKSNEAKLYRDPEAVYQLTKKLVKVLGEIPLVIKLGFIPDKALLEKVLVAIAKAEGKGVAGINTISRKAVDTKGNPALGKERLTSGICGCLIRDAALNFTQTAKEIIKKHQLDLVVMTTGGATLPEHFDEFLAHGANIAMTATTMMWDPFIAYKYHRKYFHAVS